MGSDEDDDVQAIRDAGFSLEASSAAGLMSTELGVGSAASAAIGLAPGALNLMYNLVKKSVHRSELSAARVAQRVADIVGGPEGLEELAGSTAERRELTGRVLLAAGRTTLDAKIAALSDVLKEGLSAADGAAAEAMVLVAALNDLEAPHVDLLWLLESRPTPPEELRREKQVEAQGWELSEIKKANPPVPVAEALVATLEGHGLIVDQGGVAYPGSIGPAIYRVTDLGRRCLLLLGQELEA